MEGMKLGNDNENYKSKIELERQEILRKVSRFPDAFSSGQYLIFHVNYGANGILKVETEYSRDLRESDDYERHEDSGLPKVDVAYADRNKTRIYNHLGELLYDAIDKKLFEENQSVTGRKFPEDYTPEQLERELTKAISTDVEDYTRAAVIRDELNSRKEKKQ